VIVLSIGFGVPIEFSRMVMAAGVLLLLNLIYVLRSASTPPTDIAAEIRLMKIQMVGDLFVLTVLLNLSGGVENPLLFIYVIHVIIASLLFKGREIFQIAWLAIVLFTAMVAGEYFQLIPHHHLPMVHEATHELSFILLVLASFWLVILFSAYIGALIMRHNRAIKDELVARQKDLILVDQAKNDFFRFVTHEVKSPINTAQSAVETAQVLGGTDLSPKVDDMLARAVRRLDQATDIVKDLADLTRGGELKKENLAQENLNDIVDRVVDRLKVLATRRDIDLKVMLPEPPVIMMTNRGMAETIATNVVGNAVRYCREGGRVSVRLVDTGKLVRLVVEDDGIGIEPQDYERIFEEFYRSAAAQEVSNLGTGLGLAIVKKYVTDLGGRVEVQSELGRGATFTVVLPRRSRARLASADEEAGA